MVRYYKIFENKLLLSKLLPKLLIGALIVVLPYGSVSAFAQESSQKISRQAQTELIQEGIAFLASQQNAKGIWKDGTYPTVMTALAGLAMLGAGHQPDRGPYGTQLNKAINALLSTQRYDGLISFGDSRPMYGHGYAMLFLSQAYGMTRNKRNAKIKEVLHKAIQLLIQSQSKNGGWTYAPDGGDEGSVTIVQVQALRSARNSGMVIPNALIQKSIDFIKHSQNVDGSIRYGIERGTGTVPLTAQGMAVLFNAGAYEIGDTQKRGFYFLDKSIFKHIQTGYDTHYLYTHFYAAQVYKQRLEIEQESSISRKYFEEISRALYNKAIQSTHWDLEYGPIYSTAMAVLILEMMAYDYLPIFEH